MSEELAKQKAGDIGIARAPQAVIEEATERAKALKDVVTKANLTLTIGQKEHLFFEAWQTLGQFYGYAVKTYNAAPVEINGVRGAKAMADLIDVNGVVIGGAEAYCMIDEANWKNKPWFQLASMAQTRAASKALRNRLAFVVTLAGFAATPAEEMTGTKQTQKDTRKITDPQRKRLWTIAKKTFEEQGVPENEQETMVRVIIEKYGYKSTTDITRNDYDKVVGALENWKP